MRPAILAAIVLLAQGCSQDIPPREQSPVQGRRRPPAAEEPLRLDGTSVRVRQDGSKVAVSLANRTRVDLCIARHEWIGETHEAVRVYDAAGREFAYGGELSAVTDDARPPIRLGQGETLRQEEDLARSYQVADWRAAKVVYAPVVTICQAG